MLGDISHLFHHLCFWLPKAGHENPHRDPLALPMPQKQDISIRFHILSYRAGGGNHRMEGILVIVSQTHPHFQRRKLRHGEGSSLLSWAFPSKALWSRHCPPQAVSSPCYPMQMQYCSHCKPLVLAPIPLRLARVTCQPGIPLSVVSTSLFPACTSSSSIQLSSSCH